MGRNVMLCTRVTEDVIVIATGFILFSSLTILSTSYVGKQGESEKEKVYRSGQRIFIRKASIGAPDATM